MKKLSVKKISEQIVFDVDKQETQELINEFDKFMQNRKTQTMRPYLKIAEYCLMKDNQVTQQDGKIVYSRRKIK